METDLRQDLYQEYCKKMLEIEEKREEYQRRNRNFEQERKECRERFKEENAVLERLTEMWGECEDIGRLRCELGDSFDEEQNNINQREEALAGEYQDICRQERSYEEWYKEELKNLTEEDVTWQE